MRGSQLSGRGPTRRLSRFIPFSYGSPRLGRGDGRDPSGSRWPVQLRVYAVARVQPAGSQLQGRQSSRGLTRWRPGMQRALFKPLQVVWSSNGLDFPWVAGPAAGLHSGPSGNGSSQGRPGQSTGNRLPTRWLSICVKPSSSLVIRVVRSCNDLDSPGPSVQLQDAVGHQGSSSSDRRPAAALRGGGLSEWPDHRELRGVTRDRRVAGSAAGRSVPPGNVRPPVQPRVYAVAVSPSEAGYSARQAE